MTCIMTSSEASSVDFCPVQEICAKPITLDCVAFEASHELCALAELIARVCLRRGRISSNLSWDSGLQMCKSFRALSNTHLVFKLQTRHLSQLYKRSCQTRHGKTLLSYTKTPPRPTSRGLF